MNTDLTIREGVESVWHYHLAVDGLPLCGRSKGITMPTQLPINTWGMKTHIHETYCKECERIAKERKLI